MVCQHEEECACYRKGFADGKDKAHFELRSHVRAQHAAGCGCRSCVTLRGIITAQPTAMGQQKPT